MTVASTTSLFLCLKINDIKIHHFILQQSQRFYIVYMLLRRALLELGITKLVQKSSIEIVLWSVLTVIYLLALHLGCL